MDQVWRTVRWWLVDHPAISGFEWSPDRTPFSSSTFLSVAVILYLLLTSLVRRRRLLFPPSLLRLLSAAHNVLILLLSALMASGCSLSAALYYSPRSLFCFSKTPPTPSRGPLFFWAYVYYLSKLYEFIDTLLIILSDTADRRLTFLHVYHHAVVVVMAYVWLAARQSLMPIALVTNASVHVVMYSYYLCCSVGLRWPARWKRAVTEIQIAQFVFSFAASVVFLWIHFAGGGDGCQGFNAWVFNAVFNASLLALFRDFHSGAYKEKKKMIMKAEKDA